MEQELKLSLEIATKVQETASAAKALDLVTGRQRTDLELISFASRYHEAPFRTEECETLTQLFFEDGSYLVLFNGDSCYAR